MGSALHAEVGVCKLKLGFVALVTQVLLQWMDLLAKPFLTATLWSSMGWS